MKAEALVDTLPDTLPEVQAETLIEKLVEVKALPTVGTPAKMLVVV